MSQQPASEAQRWRSNTPMLIIGGVWVIVGGLVAALTGPTGWDRGSWVAAFLVLVAGAAQIGLAAGQARLNDAALTIRFASVECVLWNVGCATVVVGTLLSNPAAVSIGSVLLLGALAMSVMAFRGTSGRPGAMLGLYRGLLVVMLVSIPIGIALSWTRH